MHAPSATLNRNDKFVIVPARRFRRSLSASLSQSRGHRLGALEGRRPGDGPGAAAAALVGLLEAAGAVSAQLQTLEAKAHGSSRSEWRQWTEQRRRRERGCTYSYKPWQKSGGPRLYESRLSASRSFREESALSQPSSVLRHHELGERRGERESVLPFDRDPDAVVRSLAPALLLSSSLLPSDCRSSRFSPEVERAKHEADHLLDMAASPRPRAERDRGLSSNGSIHQFGNFTNVGS